MKEQYNMNHENDEKCIEKEALKEYNEAAKGKITPQNQHHNVRKEAYPSGEQVRYR